MIKELVLKNRSRRRFQEEVSIDKETLKELVDLARCSASGANWQPLKYLLSWEQEKNAKIFPNLFWAAALKDWDGPAVGRAAIGLYHHSRGQRDQRVFRSRPWNRRAEYPARGR